MLGFNYHSFKEALEKGEQERFVQLKSDIDQVKACIEKGLTMFLESSSNVSRLKYPGVEM